MVITVEGFKRAAGQLIGAAAATDERAVTFHAFGDMDERGNGVHGLRFIHPLALVRPEYQDRAQQYFQHSVYDCTVYNCFPASWLIDGSALASLALVYREKKIWIAELDGDDYPVVDMRSVMRWHTSHKRVGPFGDGGAQLSDKFLLALSDLGFSQGYCYLRGVLPQYYRSCARFCGDTPLLSKYFTYLAMNPAAEREVSVNVVDSGMVHLTRPGVLPCHTYQPAGFGVPLSNVVRVGAETNRRRLKIIGRECERCGDDTLCHVCSANRGFDVKLVTPGVWPDNAPLELVASGMQTLVIDPSKCGDAVAAEDCVRISPGDAALLKPVNSTDDAVLEYVYTTNVASVLVLPPGCITGFRGGGLAIDGSGFTYVLVFAGTLSFSVNSQIGLPNVWAFGLTLDAVVAWYHGMLSDDPGISDGIPYIAASMPCAIYGNGDLGDDGAGKATPCSSGLSFDTGGVDKLMVSSPRYQRAVVLQVSADGGTCGGVALAPGAQVLLGGHMRFVFNGKAAVRYENHVGYMKGLAPYNFVEINGYIVH